MKRSPCLTEIFCLVILLSPTSVVAFHEDSFVTGVNSDVAIDGSGYFVLRQKDQVRYTRKGDFNFDSENNLINDFGWKVQGFGIDNQFNIVQGVSQDINIPIGTLNLVEATRNVLFGGNLNADGKVATFGSVTTSNAFFSDPGATVPALATDSLASLMVAGPSSVLAVGDLITVRGADKGGARIPDHTFEVGPANTTGSDAFGSTVQDMTNFLSDILGINNTVSGGVAINGAGEFVITGNTGTANDIALSNANIVINQMTLPTSPFVFTKTQTADGESVRTTFSAFDSLGTPMILDLSVVLEAKTNAGTTWRYYAQSEDDSDLDTVLGTGLLSFDTSGRLITSTNPDVAIDRVNTGAATPQAITLNFTNPNAASGSVSALADTVGASQIAAQSQDGSSLGTLADFSVNLDGTISGVFSNGLLRSLGQLSLARITSPRSLIDVGFEMFVTSPTADPPQFLAPGQPGVGRTIGGALETESFDFRVRNLTGVDLSHANLSQVDFQAAHLVNASLIKADLSGAILVHTDLTGAILFGADFSGADLTSTIGLLTAQSDFTTLYSATTIFSGTGFDPVIAGWTLIPSPSTFVVVVLGGFFGVCDRSRRMG